MALSNEQVEAFRSLEEAMWRSETRGDQAWMAGALSPTFTEHGQSGRVYDRQEILDLPIPPQIDVQFPFTDFRGRDIAENTVLLTYVCVFNGLATNRSSLWTHDGTRWLLEFHQGTPVASSAPEESEEVRLPFAKLAARIDTDALRDATFDMKLRGYDSESVDQVLRTIADHIDAGEPPPASDLSQVRFELNLRGYDCIQVDTFLAELQAQLQ